MKTTTWNRIYAVIATVALASLSACAWGPFEERSEEPVQATQQAPAPELSPSDVRSVQSALNEAGYQAGPVDGIWGPMTQSALRDFQQDRGIDGGGELNTRTVQALGLSTSEFAAGEFRDKESPMQK